MVGTSSELSPSMDELSLVLSDRAAFFRRVFTRELGRKPRLLEAHAIQRAAILTAKAEVAAADPHISPTDCVKLDNCAARARRDLAAILQAAKPSDDRTPLERLYDEEQPA
jgi:hypothetical protein